MDIKKLKRDCYKNSMASKFNWLEEMEKSLDTYDLPRLNNKEIENLNRLRYNIKETDSC